MATTHGDRYVEEQPLTVSFDVDITIPRMDPSFPLFLLEDLRRVENEWARDVHREAEKYPPPRPNSKYVRTYRLRRGWHVAPSRLTGDGLEVFITNDVEYNFRVYGREDGTNQARIHQSRWRKLLQIALSVYPLDRRAQAAINRRVQGAFAAGTIRVRP